MGIFSKKKEDTSEVETTAVPQANAPQKVALENVSAVIRRPRITEKAALLSEKNVYVFEVQKGATKNDVVNAVKSIYKVTPIKVNIVNKQPRHFMSRSKGRNMMEHGLRKAHVYLKEGDRIELV